MTRRTLQKDSGVRFTGLIRLPKTSSVDTDPAWIWEMLVRRITETSFSSRFSISWNKLSFFSFQLKNKPSAAAALTQDMITHKKVWTLSQTHTYVRTHTRGVPIYVHRQAVVCPHVDDMRRYSGRMPLHVETRSKFCNKHRFFHSLLLQCLFGSNVMRLCTDVTVFELFAVSSPCQFCSSWENFHPGRSTASSSSSSERKKQSTFQSFCLAASCFILKYS